MKKNLFVGLIALCALTMVSCRKDTISTKIEKVPCRTSAKSDWGFVDREGNVTLDDTYKSCPSMVIEGVFYVHENNGYSLYKYDAKKPKLILEDLKYVGTPEDGLLPICRKDNYIEVVNTKGEVKFSLKEMDGLPVSSCCSRFDHGYLGVEVLDTDGAKKVGLVDSKGKVVLKPIYSYIQIFGDNAFCVQKFTSEEDTDDANLFIIDRKGKDKFKINGKIESNSDEYIAINEDDDIHIYDYDGNKVLKCPSKVYGIHLFNEDKFIFSSEDGYGVMDIKGETILPSKYYKIIFLDNGYVVNRNDRWQLLDKSGEIKETLDFDYLAFVCGFRIGMEGKRDYCLLDSKFKPIRTTELVEIGHLYDVDNILYHSYTIYSDYFDYTTLIEQMLSAATSGIEERGIKFLTPLSNLEYFTEKSISYLREKMYGSTYTETIYTGNKYEIAMTIGASDKIITPIYREETRYDSWHGFYTDRVVAGYKLNGDALIQNIDITAEIPSDKVDKCHELLEDAIKTMKQSNSFHYFIYQHYDELILSIVPTDVVPSEREIAAIEAAQGI